ncbi:MAG: hypothetical protein BSR46_01240 [Candidatus Dactylopiibacterium carminicum]|nr:MAG: hypothetical protein BSR46_01240 [Candidatus Dactylopiibacterium carminicum]
MRRLWEFDALRGLMLVLMTLTHLPSPLTTPASQPFGYVSAAEGFVLLSAFMAALVYGRKGLRDGAGVMRGALLRRSAKVYLCHLGLMLFAFTLFAGLARYTRQVAATGLLSYYLDAPLTATLAALVLLYTPPLLDILPIYVMFMLISPWLMTWGMRNGWSTILTASVALWFGAQFGLGVWLYETLFQSFGIGVPVSQTGSFALWAWQLLWVIGLWLGAAKAQGQLEVFSIPRSAVRIAWALALAFLSWRHLAGPYPFGMESPLNLLFEKWTLGPLRMINLFALTILIMHHGPALAARIRKPGFLVTLGQSSLTVFCTHLMIVLLALATLGGETEPHDWRVDAPLIALCFAILYGVAWLGQHRQRTRAGAVMPA